MKLQSVIVVVCVVLFSSLAFGTRPDTSYKESPLHAAAYHGDLSAVKALVKGGADVNEIGKRSGKTPLHWAVNSGRVSIVSFSPAGGMPNFPKPDRKKLLEYIEVVRFLVQNGADMNIQDKYGRTILYQAVSDRKTEMAEIFIRQGRADVNVKGGYQDTPLHAVKDVKLAKLLISRGADVHARNYGEDTPLHRAASAEITRLLIGAGAKANVRNKDGATPLHYVVDVPSAKLLIAAGADIHARTKSSEAFEFTFGIEDIVVVDEENDVKKEKPKETKVKKKYLGRTPLHYAVCDPELVQFLVGLGADVNAKDHNGVTPLHNASFSRYADGLDSVKILVRAGAEVNAKEKNGFTPLHLASNKGHLRIMEFLMESGADVHARDDEGRVPLHVMVYDKNIRSVVSRVMGLFKQKGVDINVRDNKGRSPLHYIVRNSENLWLARTLIQSEGVDVNLKDDEGKTPFHDLMIFTSLPENSGFIQVLISAGADINARDNEGKTPLHYAGRRRREETVNSMVTAGADKNIKDNTGKIPMDYASTNIKKAILKP